MAPQLSSLLSSLKCHQIFGANTDVGKTIISTILCNALEKKYPKDQAWYLKPVSTGPECQADINHIQKFSPRTKTKCLYKYEKAVSPHIAARSDFSKPVSDSQVRDNILAHIHSCSQAGQGTLLLETAGGVNSPAPSGTIQANLYQPLRLPVCLVADHSLGGISATISAFESLHIRGYIVDALLQFENSAFQNHEYLREYFMEHGIQSFVFPRPPPRLPDANEDFNSTLLYYSKLKELVNLDELLDLLLKKHRMRIEELEKMSEDALAKIWYPFTQHKLISPHTIIPIDSACGDFFLTGHPRDKPFSPSDNEGILSPTFDGSASWWTQGLGHGSSTLSLAAAHAAGRYGHVIFAGNIHQPALKLANSLLENLKNPRLSKVFFSDNGSTGIEVAIKMAISATCKRYKTTNLSDEIGVIGLKGSYHGDTIGAMDCSEPSVYNEKIHWYKGRGYWFDFPHVSMKNGNWNIILPEVMSTLSSVIYSKHKPQNGEHDSTITEQCFQFLSIGKIFDLKERKQSILAEIYTKYIVETLERLIKIEGRKFGALIMEPVLLGAGGMLFIDPLFQNILINTVRNLPHINVCPSLSSTNDLQNTWTGVPVIFDEVFTGLYRLGRFSAASFLDTYPDISVHAKLLTGGLVPLCCTIASESIYQSFISDSKTEALLHGHSYTAHPVGCHVANTSIKMLNNLNESDAWREGKIDWWRQEDWSNVSGDAPIDERIKSQIWERGRQRSKESRPDLWSIWSYKFLHTISYTEKISSVIALGSVLAITLHDKNHGYNSTVSIELQKFLFEGTKDFRVHIRILGNVVYIMASQISELETLRKIEQLIAKYFSVEI